MASTLHPKQKHPYHLVDPSPWPVMGALAAFMLALGLILYMHHHEFFVLGIGVALVLMTAWGWWRDVLKESTAVYHTPVVQKGLRVGVVLFIASEVMFFAAFFWAFFDASLFPPEAIGKMWPPKQIKTIDPFDLPYLNTLLLLLSGTTITWAHQALLEKRYKEVTQGLGLTIVLGVLFLGVQAYEYVHAGFPFKGSIYSSTFYMATGFHGVHVLIGTIFLGVCYRQASRGQFSQTHHVGFEAAAWYWHFVDVVWLFLFVSVYWWGQG